MRTFNSETFQITSKLFRRDVDSDEDWVDVTQEALRADYGNPEGTKKGVLSVEWLMRGRRQQTSGGGSLAELIISEIPPSLVILYVKDSILTDHFEFSPLGTPPPNNTTIRSRYQADALQPRG